MLKVQKYAVLNLALAFAVIAIALCCMGYMILNPKPSGSLALENQSIDAILIITMACMLFGIFFGMATSIVKTQLKFQIVSGIIIWLCMASLFLVQKELSLMFQFPLFCYFFIKGLRLFAAIPGDPSEEEHKFEKVTQI